MIKKRTISLYGKSKNKFFSKCFLILGVFLLIIFIILYALSLFETQASTILAFSIIFLFIGVILYFFHVQFAKLAKIAEEMENEDESKDSS